MASADQPCSIHVPAGSPPRFSRRKRVLAFLLGATALSLLLIPWAEAQTGCPAIVFPIVAGDEAITVSSTSIGFTASKIDTGSQRAVRADCSIATDNIRYRVTGLAPTAAVGALILSSAGSFTVCGEQTIRQFRAIRVTNDAALFCSYYSVTP